MKLSKRARETRGGERDRNAPTKGPPLPKFEVELVVPAHVARRELAEFEHVDALELGQGLDELEDGRDEEQVRAVVLDRVKLVE